MNITSKALFVALALCVPSATFAQGTIPGAEEGARRGDAAAGPVGGIVGGAVGAATGTVGGVLGVPPDRGCESSTTRTSDGYGNGETVHRTNCP
jgi:hypothetical protein